MALHHKQESPVAGSKPCLGLGIVFGHRHTSAGWHTSGTGCSCSCLLIMGAAPCQDVQLLTMDSSAAGSLRAAKVLSQLMPFLCGSVLPGPSWRAVCRVCPSPSPTCVHHRPPWPALLTSGPLGLSNTPPHLNRTTQPHTAELSHTHRHRYAAVQHQVFQGQGCSA
jgi:hypothetical protein